MRLHLLTLSALVALSVCGSASAAVVFDTGNHIGSGRWSSTGNQAADTFTLGSDTVITDVHWKGIYEDGNADGTTDNYSIRIYNDNGANQPTPVGSWIYETTVGSVSRAATGETTQSFYTVYEYSTFIPAFNATGGVKYWLEIFNNQTDDIWYWSHDPDIGSGVSSEFTTTWITVSDQHTFQLTNDAVAEVPEAGTLAIWGLLGATALIWRRRRR